MIGNAGTPTEATFHPPLAEHPAIDAQSVGSNGLDANSGGWIESVGAAQSLALTDEGDALLRFPGESQATIEAASAFPSSTTVGVSTAEPLPARAADMVGQLVQAAST